MCVGVCGSGAFSLPSEVTAGSDAESGSKLVFSLITKFLCIATVRTTEFLLSLGDKFPCNATSTSPIEGEKK